MCVLFLESQTASGLFFLSLPLVRGVKSHPHLYDCPSPSPPTVMSRHNGTARFSVLKKYSGA
jgi:hypothetical protein